MLREFRMDLHVHTCLSPCADNTMTPPAIVARAEAAGLRAIGICDHNTGGNVAAVRKAGESKGLAVIAGMEVTTAEEVHLLAFFDGDEALDAFEDELAEHIAGKNDPEYFGDQILADENGEPLGLEERFLLGACEMKLAEVVERIHVVGGLVIASHVDKTAFSIISQLGFIPEEVPLDAIEVSPHSPSVTEYLPYRLPILRSSDAHFLEDIGRTSTRVRAEAASFPELLLALQGEGGRTVVR
jgi:PHP family Zn ribbon phosphoesterase